MQTACSTCGEQIFMCSGERPACRRCTQRRIQSNYAALLEETPSQALIRDTGELAKKKAVYNEVFQLLKNLPEQDVQGILQKIRSGVDIATILRHAKVGDPLFQLAVTPETRYRYLFPYISEMPEYFVPNNPYLNSAIYEASSLYVSAEPPTLLQSSATAVGSNLNTPEYQMIYLKPFHAAQVVDSQLSDAKPSRWTTVCKDDVLMRDLIAVFLRCEYQFTAIFQKDYFLEDMISGRKDFCSSLLVNMILAYSCVCYPPFFDRAEHWNPNTLEYQFLAEAKRLWELETAEARITTIQAGILLNVFYNLSGLDVIGQTYRIQAIELAHKLQLFDGPSPGQSDRISKGSAFTAWALYSWETLIGFNFMQPPLLKSPPYEPLPDPSEDPSWYGEIWLKYPLSQSLVPSYFGHVFQSRCQFRVIMNDFCHAAFSTSQTHSFEKADELHSRLKIWFDRLPEPLSARAIVLPGHLQLHMYYYNLILSLYEPFIDMDLERRQGTPRQVTAEASKYLHTLVRLYYLRHGFEAMDLFIVIPLILTGFECINAINRKPAVDKLEALRSTLVLTAKGLYSQSRNHHLAQALFRVIRGRMRPQEAAILKSVMNLDASDDPNETAPMEAVRSYWPVNVVKQEDKDLGSDLLTNLVNNYAHLNSEGSTSMQDPN
ncbi:hypothetical protein BX600DRAFT_511851 [Xylariales sp. PMI_506]|nr:hypothetical protein BX600DRAFT_511851 [Xylariales sp. PMI_506]